MFFVEVSYWHKNQIDLESGSVPVQIILCDWLLAFSLEQKYRQERERD
jgi:hypothetical protein